MKKLLFIILLLCSDLKAQSVELIGGASIIRPRYTGHYFVVGRFGASVNNVLLNKKLGFYALYENAKWYNGNYVDIFGLNYQLNDRVSVYYGHSIISNPTLNPSKWPITGRQDLGFSYKIEKYPVKVNVGWAFWNGPAISLSLRMPQAKVKDSDFDGVPNKLDKCPNTSAKYQKSVNPEGCPLDSDLDGIFDLDDSCKFEKGYNACFGCPDSDLDGVPNHKDKCPTVKGIAALDGCMPVEEKKIDTTKVVPVEVISEDQLAKLSKDAKITFALASADITESQLAKLTELARFLTEHRTVHVDIIGHADDIGAESSNLELSLRRANAYFAKLSNMGVYVSQMTVSGKGETQPEIEGTSEAARSANRRVEVVLKMENKK